MIANRNQNDILSLLRNYVDLKDAVVELKHNRENLLVQLGKSKTENSIATIKANIDTIESSIESFEKSIALVDNFIDFVKEKDLDDYKAICEVRDLATFKDKDGNFYKRRYMCAQYAADYSKALLLN